MNATAIDRALRTSSRLVSTTTAALSSGARSLWRRAGPALRRAADSLRSHVGPALARAAAGLRVVATGACAPLQRMLRRGVDGWQMRRRQPARPSRPRPGRSARRAWLAQLEEIGPVLVEDMLHRTSSPHAGLHDPVRFIDAGMAHGTHRYPTREFVEHWLGGHERPADLGLWRAGAIVVTVVALVSAGMLAAFT